MRRPLRKPMVMVLLGAALLVGAPALWMATRPASTVGDVAELEVALRGDASQPLTLPPVDEYAATSPTAGRNQGEGQSEPGDTSSPTLPPEVTEPPPPSPIGLRIEDLDVSAPVDPYGVDDQGRMDVPDNTTDVAWYRYGPSPGSSGSAVLAAHVDLVRQGPGVFFKLHTLDVGDYVLVDYDDGTTSAFEVAGRAVYEKSELPVDVIFSRVGPPVLTLITCGGDFSRSSGSYDSNVVVYAVPVELPTGSPG